MTDETTTFEDQAELALAIADPRYAQSSRYRDQIAAKLQASVDAGTIRRPTQSFDYGGTLHERNAFREPEAMYGPANPMPGANPLMAEAAKVRSGCFAGPEAIANAMAAPQYDLDPTYREAVRAKIDRSIREKWITPGLQALDPSQRFTR